ncbi:MAG: regulatory protein RecX [Gammaproteobacteria bacterium]|nr:MAG: regulatory protein RecX [Gammaproteobacteria bacterium]
MSEIESVKELNADRFSSEEVDRFSDPGEARKTAMGYLARREYGQHELEQKLLAAGFAAVTAKETIDKLTGEGLQDDRRFIDNFAQSRISQGKGPVRIRQELGERGLDAGLIDEVLEDVAEDWFALARYVRHKKFGPGLPREFKERARQMRFLQYRGFESGQVQEAFSPHGDH